MNHPNRSGKPTRPDFVPILALCLLLLAAPPAPLAAEEFREFTNQSGQTIRAAIVAATETEVTLKRETGAQITGGISFFSLADQALIAEWREANPQQFNADIKMDVSRQRVERDKKTEGTLIVVYETWKFAIKLENRTRSAQGGVDLDGVKVHYNISKTAKARASRATTLNSGLTPAGGLLVKAGSIDVGKLEFLKVRNLESDVMPISNSELAPGWYYPDGSKDKQADSLEGIKIRVVKDGKTIAEQTFGSKAATDTKWVEPGASGSARG